MKARYYTSSSGYICDSQTSTTLGRVSGASGQWKKSGDLICKALNNHEKLAEALERALGIFHPNSGPWSRAEKERSWAAWETQARAALAEGRTE